MENLSFFLCVVFFSSINALCRAMLDAEAVRSSHVIILSPAIQQAYLIERVQDENGFLLPLLIHLQTVL